MQQEKLSEIRLTISQEKVLKQIIDFVDSADERVFILKGYAGTGKTTLARVMAASIEGKFSRIQFTPDLLPADITGLNIYNKKEFYF